ncbi:hypothetical protein CAPTEDRAFT_200871 [Capitella teleta]|uniref:Uncharacterized protein n=1 Tax=Capitella teleta TaxID=283909 RepID=R7VJX9_CAPTE|nr:hypothetical protein CAPTEDRAFT_200871 [Capitella teleta]|eukprot:ELU16871.1 hypothetical protein CAPTEDRAFT_200871 [Capitella teleta]
MKAILLIVLLHSAIAQQSDEVADRREYRLVAGLQQLLQAVQLIAQHPTAMGEQLSAMADRISAMEGRMTEQIANITERMTSPISTQEQHQSCDLASAQFHLHLLTYLNLDPSSDFASE